MSKVSGTEGVFGSLPKAGFLRRNKQDKQHSSQHSISQKRLAAEGSKATTESDGSLSPSPDLALAPEKLISSGLPRRISDESMPSEASSTDQRVSPESTPLAGLFSPVDDVLLRISHANKDRRGSAISSSSYSVSYSSGPSNPAYYMNHRNSLSSFASSGGSPRVPSSSHHTIGDLSTGSMPLLPEAWSHPSSNATNAPSINSRRSASISDASSTGSVYPPVPRVGPNGSVEAFDAWKAGTSSHNPALVNKRHTDSQLYALSHYSMGQNGRNRVAVNNNPFGPLRKRLLRTVGNGKRVGVEIQLLVELVDALETYIRFACSTLPVEERIATLGTTEFDLQNEIRSLIAELCEVTPEAQSCLAAGFYGPLSFPKSQARHQQGMYDPSLPSWWPRRLARDCRLLLEELGFSTSSATPTVVRTPASGPNSPETDVESGQLGKTGWDQIIAHVIKEDEDDDDGKENGRVIPRKGSTVSATENGPESPARAAAKAKRLEENAARRAARQQQLLDEGKRRWAAYRASQQGSPVFDDLVNA